MLRAICGVLFSMLLAATAVPCSAASPTLVLRAGTSSCPLAGHIDILEDKDGTLTIGDVASPAFAARFKADTREIPTFGFTKSVYWLRFTVARDAGAKRRWLLELAASNLHYVDLYVPLQAGGFDRMQAGSMRPMSIRKYPHRNPVFPLDIDVSGRTFYLRANARVFTFFPLKLLTPDAFSVRTHRWDICQGCFFGAILVMCAYHFFLFISLRDRTYLYYVFDIFCLALFEFATNGLILETITAEHPAIIKYGFLTGVLATFAALLFARSFLSTGRNAPFIDLLLRIFMTMTILVIPAALVVSPATGKVALTVITIGSSIILLVAGVRIHRMGYHPARYYLAARIFRIVGVLLYASAVLRILSWKFSSLYGIQIGTVVEVGLLAFALADRINVMRREKEAAEEEALRVAMESEQKAVELAREMTVELREALAGEQRALERQNRFMAMLSHEYRTPLAIIRANLDLMELQDAAPGASHEPRLSIMKHAVGRLVEVMEVSLQKERLNGFRTPVALERLELVPFLDAVIDSAEGLWPERFFVFHPEMADAAIMGEAGTLKTALFNLLDNACKYSPPDEPVAIECRFDTCAAVVVVRDRGTGINPGEADKVFEKYYRGASSSDTSGAGVGLWLVRQIVEQLGGAVSLERCAEGGTSAVIRLPLA